MRAVLITGATGKFGHLLVADRLFRGNTVIAVGRRKEALAVLSEVHAADVQAKKLFTVDCDLTLADSAARVVERCRAAGVMPNYLINNARNLAFLQSGPDGAIVRENFIAELTLDVVVPGELTLAFANSPNAKLERVVNIGSQYGLVAPNRALYVDHASQPPIQYGVAKAALIHLTRELAVRLAPRVQVNCVSFGGVEGRADVELQRRYASLAPTGRMLREDEIAGPVDFLLSDASSGMTGHNLVVDGGWTVW
ncbi:MAG: SDR family oxidoreductase [Pseudorhodoplanes sp.]|jgi:NAD(P)-dependent dehydrogenase (short-subunit alcohol dehydrogenase family)|nr:SDR family oxidoreductase [Pseudorhodoplanes sp.]